MARFEELQDLWQHQQPPAGTADGVSLTRAIGSYGRRQTWINIAKLILVTALIAWGMAHSSGSRTVLAGEALMGLNAIVLLVAVWRNQLRISRLNFAEPSAGFVRSAIERLMEQREPLRKYYWQFVLAMVVGMNVILMAIPDTMAPLGRLCWHAIGSALPFAIYELGRWVRARRFEAECRPLVNRLISMQQSLEERSE